MMLHASDTDREADLWRLSLFARFGWWARICERAGCGRGEGDLETIAHGQGNMIRD